MVRLEAKLDKKKPISRRIKQRMRMPRYRNDDPRRKVEPVRFEGYRAGLRRFGENQARGNLLACFRVIAPGALCWG